MELQLSKNNYEFSSQIINNSINLDVLENALRHMLSNKDRLEYNNLNSVILRLTPGLSRLRLDCLNLSLSKNFQDHSGDLFLALDHLNQLVELLKDLANDTSESSLPDTFATKENISIVLILVAKVKWQLSKVAHNKWS
jgi:hypothetical protein